MKSYLKSRQRTVEFVRQRLLRDGFPRLQVSIIILLTGLAGFITSFFLLQMGLSAMVIRYPICIAIAYGFFLLFLGIWLWMQRHQIEPDFDVPAVDIANVDFNISENSTNVFGGGADFAGAGSGSDWGEKLSSSAGESSILDGVSVDLDFEEFGLIILAVVAVIGGLLASLYIIYIAPLLLAEILVDGILVTGLYRSVRKIERQSWLNTAVKKTLIAAILAAIFFGIAGFALQSLEPEARTFGEVWSSLSRNGR